MGLTSKRFLRLSSTSHSSARLSQQHSSQGYLQDQHEHGQRK